MLQMLVFRSLKGLWGSYRWLCLLSLLLASCQEEKPSAAASESIEMSDIEFLRDFETSINAEGEQRSEDYIAALSLDKATYLRTDRTFTLEVALKNTSFSKFEGEFVYSLYHLESLLDGYTFSESISIEGLPASQVLWSHTTTLPLPAAVNKGYMLKVSLIQNNNILDSQTIGFDILSDWKNFPRYGFVSEFDANKNHENPEIFKQLNRFRLNGVMFYDWQYTHQQPYHTGLDQWRSLDANKLILADNLRGLISEAHKINQKVFNYNLIYGADDKLRKYPDNSYFDFHEWSDDQPSLQWALYIRGQDNTLKIDFHDEKKDWRDWGWMTNRIMVFNPCNSDWQRYFFAKEKLAFDKFAFDGWHMDTLGDRSYKGVLVDYTNKLLPPLNSCYPEFVSTAKQYAFANDFDSYEEKHDRIVFNSVGGPNGGLEEVAASPTDILFTELWSDKGTETYSEVINLIDKYRLQSKKQIVVAGYINRDTSLDRSEFLEDSVLLAHAAIYAAGGSLFAMGDKGRLTCSPFLSYQRLRLSSETKSKLLRYYDFITAYENLLRGSFAAKIDKNAVSSADVKLCSDDTEDCVLTLTRDLLHYKTVQLVNFMGQENTKWSDPEGKASRVPLQTNLQFKMRLNNLQKFSSAWIVSPDRNKGLPLPLNFTISRGSDGQRFLKFKVPELNIWDLIFFRKAADGT